MRKSILVFLSGLLVIIIVGLIIWYRAGMSDSGPTPTSTQKTANFEKTGNLIRNNPGFKSDTWYLSYEQPGSPGLNKELAFDQNSSCKGPGGNIDCLGLSVENGTPANVTGYDDGNKVVVSELTISQTPVANAVEVTFPVRGQEATSSIIVQGKALGNWFFEGSLPVRLVAQNKTITSTPAMALTDWMSSDLVPFEAVLQFTVNTTTPAEVVIAADNPSGLPQNDKEFRVPVILHPGKPMKTVKLYFYNQAKDTDATGQVVCGKQGIVPVYRSVPVSPTPLADTIKLLLLGGLTADERESGISTEFTNSKVELKSAVIDKNGVATLTFSDPDGVTTGGSCRIGILWNQIEATAKQFPSVKQVKFAPADLFQP